MLKIVQVLELVDLRVCHPLDVLVQPDADLDGEQHDEQAEADQHRPDDKELLVWKQTEIVAVLRWILRILSFSLVLLPQSSFNN